MITHFTEMHVEHSPAERCEELGDALNINRMLSFSFSFLILTIILPFLSSLLLFLVALLTFSPLKAVPLSTG